jgi:hypothetical protein
MEVGTSSKNKSTYVKKDSPPSSNLFTKGELVGFNLLVRGF